MKKLNQKQKILNHFLEGKELSELEAIRLGMGTSMRSRVSDLRAEGYPIEDRYVKQYKVYFLNKLYLERVA